MSSRNDEQIFQEFERLASTQIGFPQDFHILFLVGNSAKYITQHSALTAFEDNIATPLPKRREKIIEVFSRIEFLVDELIKIYVIGINHHRETEFYSLYDKMGIGSKIRLLNEWGLIDGTFRATLQNLISVRNSVAHDVSLHETTYNDEHIFTARDVTQFDNFRADLQNAWAVLREIYREKQEQEDWDLLLDQIEAWQLSQQNTSATQE